MAKAKSQKEKRYWQQHIEGFNLSCMSKTAYCKAHDIVYHQFLYWHDKLTRIRRVKSPETEIPETNSMPFIPVSLRSKPKAPTTIPLSKPISTEPKANNLDANSSLSSNGSQSAKELNLLCMLELKRGHKLLVYSISALDRVLAIINNQD